MFFFTWIHTIKDVPDCSGHPVDRFSEMPSTTSTSFLHCYLFVIDSMEFGFIKCAGLHPLTFHLIWLLKIFVFVSFSGVITSELVGFYLGTRFIEK